MRNIVNNNSLRLIQMIDIYSLLVATLSGMQRELTWKTGTRSVPIKHSTGKTFRTTLDPLLSQKVCSV